MTTLRTLTLALLLTTTRAAAGPCDEVASTVRQTNELRRRGAHDAAVTRLETGAGYYLRRNLVAKGAYQHNWRNGGSVRSLGLFAVQLHFWL